MPCRCASSCPGPRAGAERLIGIREGRLKWGLSPPLPGAGPGYGWTERSEIADRVLDWIAQRLAKAPSAALIVDYGYVAADRPDGPTLQAVRDHDHVDPLETPGEADLTWLIDFDQVAARLAARVACQGGFLAAMGIGNRAAALARAAPERAEEIADQLERLTAPTQMGTLFKVAGAVSAGLPPPPGFRE